MIIIDIYPIINRHQVTHLYKTNLFYVLYMPYVSLYDYIY